MITKNYTGFVLAIGILSCVLMTGCDERPEIGNNEAIRVSKELVTTQQTFEQIYLQVQNTAATQSELNSFGISTFSSNPCLKLQVDAEDTYFFPATYTFDYGDGCKTGDHTFAGELAATFNGFVNQDNSSIDIALNNLYLNSNKIEGKYSLISKGKNNLNRLEVEQQIQNGKVKYAQSELNYGASIFATQVNVLYEENSNQFPEAIEFTWEQIINATFVDSESTFFTITTVAPIVNISSWPVPVGGTLKVENTSNGLTFYLDFGDYTRDQLLSIQIGDEITELSL